MPGERSVGICDSVSEDANVAVYVYTVRSDEKVTVEGARRAPPVGICNFTIIPSAIACVTIGIHTKRKIVIIEARRASPVGTILRNSTIII